ncbi:MAG: hypothetical protein LBT38_00835 [Deltaproteobacteria bacterium]|jgi:hypothetical protein|nr:hypothetical protein [Deltaproteobacteria bacterium]
MSFSLPKKLFFVLLASLFLLACAPKHEYKPMPIRDVYDYSNRTDVGGAIIAAEALYDDQLLEKRFGYNLKKAKVIPVNLIVQNNTDETLIILPGAILSDANRDNWDLLPQNVIIDRVSKYTGSGVSLEDGVGRTAKGAVVGAILGAAVGIATGTNVGAAAGKGAAVGGAVGASSAILGVGGEDNAPRVAADYTNLSLNQTTLGPGDSTHGLLFFPGEAGRPIKLTLRIRIGGEEQAKTVALPL